MEDFLKEMSRIVTERFIRDCIDHIMFARRLCELDGVMSCNEFDKLIVESSEDAMRKYQNYDREMLEEEAIKGKERAEAKLNDNR